MIGPNPRLARKSGRIPLLRAVARIRLE